MRILVVDDDPVLIDLIPSLLTALGHIVETADTGERALLRITRPPLPDAILIDLRLPGMDGTTLATTVAALPHPPRLIGMSAGTPSVQQRSHFTGFLPKPFGMEDLTQALANPSLQPMPSTTTATTDPVVLDRTIYRSLAASIPPAKLIDLYDRTLSYIRESAPKLDTASETERLELAHTLHGCCAMVGAVDLATLAAQLNPDSATSPPDQPGASSESSFSYKILRAADHLERILISLQST